jgi:tetratricopeptide (TPR) repeat protein
VLGGILVTLALVGLAAWAVRRGKASAAALGATLILFPLAPSLNTVSLSGMLFAERHLYIPACGFALLAGWGVSALARRGRVAIAAAATLALVLTGAGLGTARVLEWRSAERLARSSLQRYPGGAEVWAELGLELGRQGRHDEAAEALAQAVELQPASARAWQAYGVALVNAGRPAEGADAWRSSIERAPGESGALWYGLAEAELLAGRLEQAGSAARRAVDLRPDDAASRVLLARVLLARDAPEEAVDLLRAAAEASPAGRAALDSLLGQALLRTAQRWLLASRPDRALELAREATELPRLPPDGRFLAGLLAHRAGRLDLASGWFEKALAEDPELLRRKHEAARRLESEGRPLEAASTYREILAARPDHVPTLFNLGRVLLLAGRAGAAVEPLRRGLEIEDDARARQMLDQATRAAAGQD